MTTTESSPPDARVQEQPVNAAAGRAAGRLRSWQLAAYLLLLGAVTVAVIGPSNLSWAGSFVAFESGAEWTEFPPGDHIQLAYEVWLWEDALTGGGHMPWTDPYLFGAGGGPVTILFGWPLVLLAVPVSLIWGPVAAYNACVYLGLILAGLATAAWVRSLGTSHVAAGAAGLAYMCAPFRVMQGIGHATAFLAWMFPVLALCLEQALRGDEHRARLWGWGAAAAAISIIVSGELHHAVFAVLFAGIYVAVRLPGTTLARVRLLALPGMAAVAGGAAGALVLYVVLIRPSGARGGRTMEEAALYAPRLHEFLSTTAATFERYVYVGRGIALLAAIGVVAAVLGRRRALAGVLVVATIGCVWFAIAPGFTEQSWIQDTYRLVPFFGFSRVPGRLMVVGALLVAALAGLGVNSLRWRNRPWILLPIAVLLVLDLPAPYGNAPAGGNPYEGLAENAAILELPVYDADNAGASVYSMFVARHPGPRVGGYYVLVSDESDTARQQARVLQNDLTNTCVWRALARRGELDYVAVHHDRYGPSISQRADDPERVLSVLRSLPGLEEFRTRGVVTVFEVRPSEFACPAEGA